ncbi:MAG TPA: hypothetical protein VLI71_07615 [Gammaproteobacteria bacterium]|nr:hypothetical protein [Gammaproteobacteria bacterium]
MRLNRTWCVVVGLAAITGCSRQQPAPCEPEARYSTARSAQPVQIPDDLSPPDESDAIRLPTDVAPVASITAGECLEAPPPFFGDSRPFLNTAEEESRKSRREARREAKREARAAEAAPAAEPDAAPAEQRDPAPADSDRTIDN